MLAAVLLAGCVNGYDTCAECQTECEPNVKIDFAMMSLDEPFDRLKSMQVGIFDGEGEYLRTENLSRKDLEKRMGVDLTLAKGEYRLVFWANADQYTRLVKTDAGGDWQMSYAKQIVEGKSENMRALGDVDSLFYGPGALKYLKVGVYDERPILMTVGLRSAHRVIELFIDEKSNVAPLVELQNLPLALHYSGMRRSAGSVSYAVQSERITRAGRNYYVARFRVFRFDDANEVQLVIHGPNDPGSQPTEPGNPPAGTPPPAEDIYNSSLTDAIEAAGGNVDDMMDHADIELIIRPYGLEGEVEITIPNWDKNEVSVQ